MVGFKGTVNILGTEGSFSALQITAFREQLTWVP